MNFYFNENQITLPSSSKQFNDNIYRTARDLAVINRQLSNNHTSTVKLNNELSKSNLPPIQIDRKVLNSYFNPINPIEEITKKQIRDDNIFKAKITLISNMSTEKLNIDYLNSDMNKLNLKNKAEMAALVLRGDLSRDQKLDIEQKFNKKYLHDLTKILNKQKECSDKIKLYENEITFLQRIN